MLRNLAAVMIRPRATIRRILDGNRDRLIIPLVLLAICSGYLGDIDRGSLEMLKQRQPPIWMLLGMLVGITLVLVAVFYLVSWAAYWLGRLMEGTGSPRDVRLAVAWGLAPGIWALLYRIPAAFLSSPQSLQTRLRVGDLKIEGGASAWGCALAVLIALLEGTVFVWWVAATANTVGEAHRFSSWRGLATVILVVVSPFIIILAAVLAM